LPTDPYIGITDFTNVSQVRRMLNVLWKHRKAGSKRMLHIGVMMSYKTLKEIDTKWSKAFPPKEKIKDIFWQNDPDVYNCLHYADYVHRSSFETNLSRAIGYGGVYLHALQLDMVWPDPGGVAEAVHRSRKMLQVILQINSVAIAECDNSPQQVVQALDNYDGVIHRVLIDRSMGRGLGMDAIGLLPYIHAIRECFPNLGITVAGGLGPDTMHLVEPLVKEFPDISIDAQGKLRPSGNALDPIDWDMAEKYLVSALHLLK
jgi:hypothetical protein